MRHTCALDYRPTGEQGGSNSRTAAKARTNAPRKFRRTLVDWLTENFRPFSIVEDAALSKLFKQYAKIVLPSPKTLKNDMFEVAAEVTVFPWLMGS